MKKYITGVCVWEGDANFCLWWPAWNFKAMWKAGKRRKPMRDDYTTNLIIIKEKINEQLCLLTVFVVYNYAVWIRLWRQSLPMLSNAPSDMSATFLVIFVLCQLCYVMLSVMLCYGLPIFYGVVLDKLNLLVIFCCFLIYVNRL